MSRGALLSASFRVSSPPEVDRIWGVWRPYDNIPKAIFHILKADFRFKGLESSIQG